MSNSVADGSVEERSRRQATRLAFFVAGAVLASWAPLVPIARQRIGLDEGGLGLLLLCLGAGSVLTMPITGMLVERFGCRRVIATAVAIALATLPALASLDTAVSLALALFVFGASVGSADVAINIQASELERRVGRSIMSGFHGTFSIGGIAGAIGLTWLLRSGMMPTAAAAVVAAICAAIILVAIPNCLSPVSGAGGSAKFTLPRGKVALFGVMSLLCFLAEGTVLDWSGVILVFRGADITASGLGYAAFATAMALGRLSGDRIRSAFDDSQVVLFGSLLSASGFAVLILVPWLPASYAAYFMIGAGASNIVPVVFSAAGRAGGRSRGTAIAAVTTMGYLGLLLGPGVIGLVAHATNLFAALGAVGFAMMLIASQQARFKPGAR